MIHFNLFFRVVCCLGSVLLCGCGGNIAQRVAEFRHPFIVIGVDGAEWSAIEQLWQSGQLQELKRLAQTGARAQLATDYGASPVIWTTIATGVRPQRHGIRGFTVPTESGDVPISSTIRRVPAVWNMVSTAGLRVGVLGWWGSWPAEDINGVMVTDRVLRVSKSRIWPEERRNWFEAEVNAALTTNHRNFERWTTPLEEDEVQAYLATKIVGEEFDLLMLYLRAPDVAGHIYWRYFRPDAPAYGGTYPDDLDNHRDRVPAAYRGVDASIKRLLAAAPADANVIVLSDHGFSAARPRTRVLLDLDPLLEHLGFLSREEQGRLDFRRTRLYTYATPGHRPIKKLRFPTPGREPNGTVSPGQRNRIRRQLTQALQTVTFGNGSAAFEVRIPNAAERAEGADLIVQVNTDQADASLLVEGERIDGVIRSTDVVTGGHHKTKAGILIANGPDINPDADLEGLSIFDITPTLLYGLGLPVAEDFAGEARVDLYTREFHHNTPLRMIESWGTRESTDPEQSGADSEILDELRALGYLD